MIKKTLNQLIFLAVMPLLASYSLAAETKGEDPIMALLETRAHLVSDDAPRADIKLASYSHSTKNNDPLGDLLEDKVLQKKSPATMTDVDPLGNLLKKEVISQPKDKRQIAVNMAFNYLNIPYKWGGNSAMNGFDCSGLVRAVYLKAGKSLPRSTAEQASATSIIKRNQLQPGDLVFFNTNRRKFSHVGIYVGDDKFIHSPSSGEQVRIEELSSKYWNKHFTGARRVELK